MATVSDPGRVVVVGGASGIGAACVELLARSGRSVLCADLRPPAGDAAIAAAVEVDVRDADAVDRAIAELADGDAIGGMVYAAGVGHVAPFAELDPSRWKLVIEVNLTGAYHCARAVLPHMTSGGAMVLISSIDSASPVSGLAHYCASKAGLEALSRSIALELAPHGIRSNIVAPGPVRTPLMEDFYADPARERAFVSRIPLGTIAEPSHVAEAVAFLLSDAAAQVTGTRLPVDGGMSLREHPSMLTIERGTP